MKNKSAKAGNTKLKQGVLCAVIALPCFAGAVALGALVFSSFDFNESAANPIATISAAAGCFLASLFVSKYIKSRGLIIGAAIGGIIFIFFLSSALISGQTVGLAALYKLIIFVCAGALGGSIGILNSGKSKKNHTNKNRK